jgi:hypothetical protein
VRQRTGVGPLSSDLLSTVLSRLASKFAGFPESNHRKKGNNVIDSAIALRSRLDGLVKLLGTFLLQNQLQMLHRAISQRSSAAAAMCRPLSLLRLSILRPNSPFSTRDARFFSASSFASSNEKGGSGPSEPSPSRFAMVKSRLKTEGRLMKNGIKALFAQISYDRNQVNPANVREKRQEKRFRRDVFVGMPATLVIQILPASPLLILLAFKYWPSILPSTIIQARIADGFREKEALPIASVLKKRVHLGEDKAKLELKGEVIGAFDGGPFSCSEVAAEHTARLVAPSLVPRAHERPLILESERLTAHFGKPPVLEFAAIEPLNGNGKDGNWAPNNELQPVYKKRTDEEGKQRTMEILLMAASRLATQEAGEICARLHHDVVGPLRHELQHRAESLMIDLPASTIKAAVTCESGDSNGGHDSSALSTLYSKGLADYSAAILHDDWLLSREMWAKTGLFEEELEKINEQDPKALRRLARELEVVCAQRLLIEPVLSSSFSSPSSPEAPSPALDKRVLDLQGKLRWWLRLAAVVPVPLLLHLTHLSTRSHFKKGATAPARTALALSK